MIQVAAAVIRQGKQVLICQRPAGKNCALLWEFPGGKVEEGEDSFSCVVRELMEELNISVEPQKLLCSVTHTYPDRTVHIDFIECTILKGTPQAREHAALRWIEKSQLDEVRFCPADYAILDSIFYE